MVEGSERQNATLNEAIVIEARKSWDAGETCANLARKYSVARTTMRTALSGKTWSHVTPLATRSLGGSINMCKLNDEIVRDCRKRYRSGTRCAALAAEFGVGVDAMRRAITRKSWAHVT